MSSCPSCGAENPASLKFCGECGARLKGREVSPAAPDPGPDRSLSAERTLRPGAPVEAGLGPGPDPSLTLSDQRTLRAVPDGPAALASATAPAAGGRYRVVAKLGQGGMGVVWKAEDLRFTPPRVVALKRLLASDAANRGAIARFLQEAGAVAQLNHLNIVTVHDVGEDAEGHYIVMEYVEGKTLADLIRQKGKLPVEDAVRLLRGIGNALSYAHRKRVVHRDIKPGNVLVAHDGTPKVLDFGLARVGGGSELSVSGYGMGTADYASPEQKRDAKAADHRSDIYSLGATMYHMLTGETPRTIRSDRLPPELDQVVLKCLEERPEDRYFSVDELLADLEKAASGKGAAPRKKVVIEEEPEGTCVACWYLNKPEARFCKKCGAGLFEPCVRCKKEIRAGSEHCIHCGVDVPKARKMAEHLAQAMEHLGGKRYDRALKELSLLLAIEPKNTEALRLHGEASQSQDEAKRFREEAEGFIKAEEYERAQKVLEEYLVLAPEDAEARKLLEELPGKIVERDCARAEALEKDGKVQLALGLYEAVLSREPQNEKARAAATRIRARKAAEHLAQAKEHLEGRRYGRALKELDLLLELEPKSPEAVALRKEVIHKKHEEARALRDLADGHVKAAQHERAQKALEEYLALVPEDIDARKLLAELPGKIVERRECARAEALELDGKAQLALGIYEGVLSTEPQNEKARAASRRIQAQLARSRRRVMLVMATAAAGLLVAGLLGYQLMGNGERARRDETSVFAPEATPAGHPTPTPSGTATRPGEAFTNTLGMKLVLIPPGEYLMGSPPGEEGRDGDESQHRVKITRPFYLGVTEVTQAQWRAVMKTDPSHFKGDKLPVEQISWEDAKAFCQKLSEREGKKYRLPTEAEWEYACRAGTTTPYYTGLTIGGEHANYDGERTRPVSRFSANAWGLYDMHGNVFEWCQDWFGPYPPGDVVDPDGPASGNSRVLRGGSWDKQEWISRSADRRHWEPGIRRSFLGFRVALDF